MAWNYFTICSKEFHCSNIYFQCEENKRITKIISPSLQKEMGCIITLIKDTGNYFSLLSTKYP